MASVKESERAPRLGNIYFRKGCKTGDYPIGRGSISQALLTVQMLDRPGNESENKWRKQIYRYKPVIVDFSPSCDFSQDKTFQCRFIMGLLIPVDLESRIKGKAPFVKKIGPVNTRESDSCPVSGEYYLTLNSRYVTGIKSSIVAKNAQAYRFRKQVLTDIQHWFASQAARPGYISIGH
jgi:hypothetical protein